MATTRVATIRQTGFKVDDTDVRFGLLWPDGGFLMNDWTRPSKTVDLEGPTLTVTQLLGFGPRRVTYRVFFETISAYQALEALVQETGTLTLVDDGHTLTVPNASTEAIHGRRYDRIESATLLSLSSWGVAADQTVEADATFQVSA